MNIIRNINPLSIFIGFTVIVATSIFLSLLNLVLFKDLLSEGASLNVLMQSTVPLIYSLVVLSVSISVGVVVASKMASRTTMVNSICVTLIYGGFAYLLSQSPSNIDKYPQWYSILSYVVLLPSALIGHFASLKLVKDS